MSKDDFTRREFIGVSAAIAGASIAEKTIRLAPKAGVAPRRRVAPSDTVRFGMVTMGR